MHYAIAVEPNGDYTLTVLFDDGKKRVFDVKPYLADPFFAPLRNRAIFSTASVGPITVGWMNDIDIAPEELYLDSVPIDEWPPDCAG